LEEEPYFTGNFNTGVNKTSRFSPWVFKRNILGSMLYIGHTYGGNTRTIPRGESIPKRGLGIHPEQETAFTFLSPPRVWELQGFLGCAHHSNTAKDRAG